MMPEMNGWEFLEWKKGTTAAETPVFVLSGSDTSGLESLRCFQKPVDVDKLLDSIERHFLEERRG